MEKTFNLAQNDKMMTLDERKLKNFKNYFFYIEGIFYFLQGLYTAGLQVYLTYYMTNVFKLNFATMATVGALVGIPTYLKMFTGLLSDRVPVGKFGRRKPYLILGGILFIPSFILLTTITTYSPLWLGIVILCFCCFVLVDGTADALTVDITPDRYTSKMQGFANGGRYAGMAVGIVVTSFASPIIGWVPIIMILGVAAVGQAFVTLLFKEIKLPDTQKENIMPIKKAFKTSFTSKSTWLGLFFAIFFMGGYGLMNVISPLVMKNTSQAIYGISNMFCYASIAISSFATGVLVHKFGGFTNKNVFILFIITWVCVFPWLLVDGNWNNTFLVIFAQCTVGIGRGIVSVATYGILMRLCIESMEGFLFAIFTSVMNIGLNALAPNIISFFGETLGFGMIPAMFTMLPVMLLGLLAVPLINKNIEKNKKITL